MRGRIFYFFRKNKQYSSALDSFRLRISRENGTLSELERLMARDIIAVVLEKMGSERMKKVFLFRFVGLSDKEIGPFISRSQSFVNNLCRKSIDQFLVGREDWIRENELSLSHRRFLSKASL